MQYCLQCKVPSYILRCMKVHRFYTPHNLSSLESFQTDDTELLHQLKDVFRLSKGDKVVFFDGSGYEYLSSIEVLTKKEGEFTIESKEYKEEKEGRKIHVYISIIKKDKLELAIEKAVELGVDSITPVIAERSQYKKVRVDRLEKIIKEATEQCGRVRLPKLGGVKTFNEVMEEHPDIVVFHMEGKDIKEVSLGDDVSFLIGPEGGWSERELALCETVALPFDTLRAETAVIAGVVLVS